MARVLLVGCGCRGRGLARALRADGHAVRGTTRDPAGREAIAAAGAQPWVGDPDRVASLTGALEGAALVCWLLGSARGEPGAVGENWLLPGGDEATAVRLGDKCTIQVRADDVLRMLTPGGGGWGAPRG